MSYIERARKLQNSLNASDVQSKIAGIEKSMVEPGFWDDRDKSSTSAQELSDLKKDLDNIEMLELLIQYGAKVNVIGGRKEFPTPIFIAASREFIKNMEILINNGADLHVKNSRGENVIQLVHRLHRTESVAFLAPYYEDGEKYLKPSHRLPPGIPVSR